MIKKLILIITMFGITSCTYNKGVCNGITDLEAIKYVTTNLSINLRKVDFVSYSEIVKTCKRLDLIGCTTSKGEILVLQSLIGKARVEIIAHELYHSKQFSDNVYPIEIDAKNYGLTIANTLCK